MHRAPVARADPGKAVERPACSQPGTGAEAEHGGQKGRNRAGWRARRHYRRVLRPPVGGPYLPFRQVGPDAQGGKVFVGGPAFVAGPLRVGFRLLPGGCRMARGSFQVGATARFPRGIVFRGARRKRGGFGHLVGTRGFGRQVDRVALGGEAFGGVARQFFFAPGAFARRLGEFRGGELAALGIDLGLFFFVEPVAQGDFGQPFGVGLLRHRLFRGGIRLGPLAGLRGGEFLGLAPALQRGGTFEGRGLPLQGVGARSLVGAGPHQRVGFRRALGQQQVAVVPGIAPGFVAGLPRRGEDFHQVTSHGRQD